MFNYFIKHIDHNITVLEGLENNDGHFCGRLLLAVAVMIFTENKPEQKV